MAKGKEKVAAADVPSKVEKATNDERDIAELTPSEPTNIEEEATAVVLDMPEEDNNEENKGGEEEEDKEEEEEDKEEEDKEEEEEEDKEEEKKEDGKGESVATDTVPEDKVEDVKDDAKPVNASNKKKGKRIRNRKKKAAGSVVTSSEAVKTNDANKSGSSAVEKEELKKADGMGLVFMCNAKTRHDCFKYKVLGLPASKKEAVAKIYKGMRLFLFDVDSKLMHGIFKASSPGGYNIEPKAFKSAFPSQVRYTVLHECSPLPEEKFKEAIKGNYFGKNKFNTQLSPEQVKNLCKLFRSSGKPSKKRDSEAIRGEPESKSVRQERNVRPRREIHERPTRRERPRQERPRQERPRQDRRAIPRGRDLYARREVYASPPPLYARREVYASPPPPLYARREVIYASPPRAMALPPLLPPSYVYDRPPVDDYYRREPAPFEVRDPRIMDLEMRPREPIEYRDPYGLYREPPPYREVAYAPASLPYAPAPASLPPAYPSSSLYHR